MDMMARLPTVDQTTLTHSFVKPWAASPRR